MARGAFICIAIDGVTSWPTVTWAPPGTPPTEEDIFESYLPIQSSNFVYFVDFKGNVWVVKHRHSPDKTPFKILDAEVP